MNFNKLKFYFFNRQFRKTKPKNIFLNFNNNKIDKLYNQSFNNKKKLILTTQVGRGGGKWLVDIINQCKNVRAFGERNRKEESIFRYNCSHLKKKPSKKLIKLIKTEALSDWEVKNISYISSPYFSHGISGLSNYIRPNKIVIIIRDFKGLFNSLINKGWYSDNYSISNPNNIKNLPKKFINRPNHFYGRYLNFKELNKKFISSNQTIRVALFMLHTIKKIYQELLMIDKDKLFLFNLKKADQNYLYCKNFLKQLDLNLAINEKKFLSLKKRTSSEIENEDIRIDKKDNLEVQKFKFQYENYLKKINKLLQNKKYQKI